MRRRGAPLGEGGRDPRRPDRGGGHRRRRRAISRARRRRCSRSRARRSSPGSRTRTSIPAYGARNLLNVNLDDLHAREDYLGRIEAVADANPGPRLDRRRRVVQPGVRRDRWAPQGGPRRGRARPSGLPDEHRRARGVGELPRRWRPPGSALDSPDPWDGYLVRDPDGSPTGCLQEGAAYDVLRDGDRPAERGRSGRPTCCGRSRSCTRSASPGGRTRGSSPTCSARTATLADEGALTMRVVASLWWDRHLGMEQIDGLVEQREWATGGTLDASTIKIMLDGCPESCTASMLEPVRGRVRRTARHGDPVRRRRGAAPRRVVALDARGFQVHQHALGDRAVRSALDAVEAARTANGWNDARHHLAHIQLPAPRRRAAAAARSAWSRTSSRTGASPTPRSSSSRCRAWGSARRACTRSATSCAAAP